MRLGLLLLASLAPLAVQAGPALVTSGEHPGFTRLVMQYDGPVNWQLGRTLDGYALRVQDDRPGYDLSKAFNLIGKGRLAALWPDSATGDLHFGIACACYAMPFEFRPGIVVVDLYDGAPPKGSSFEQPLDLPVPKAPPVPEPVPAAVEDRPPLYDWTTLALPSAGPRSADRAGTGHFTPLSTDLASAEDGLQQLRLSLIEEMSRGASQGIVDMAKPKAPPEPAPEDPNSPVAIHLGETPNLVVRQKGEEGMRLGAEGAACISDEQLDITFWGANRPVRDQIGPERQGLTGEFDKPDPDAVTRAVRFNLFLGFGAEARALTRAFPNDLPDRSIWDSMARILDQDPDPAPAFTGMQDCDTAAALWATLADPEARPTDEIGKAAILRSFSAMPPHLRRLLGPRLVERFLQAEDFSVATALRDAVLRAPGDPGPEIVVMQAAMSRAMGEPGKAEAQLEPLAATSGPASAEALVALVEQRATLGQTVDFKDVQTLEELLKERKDGAEAPRFQHALILGRAASGDYDTAFAEAAETPDTVEPLWTLLAQAGPDTALLRHATLAAGQPAPMAARKAAGLIADRMLGLGLADQAAAWLSQAESAPTLLRARVALAQGKAQVALGLLAEDSSAPALAVKADALQSMQEDGAAAEVFAQLGKPEEQWAALSRSQDWEALAKEGPEPWKAVAGIILPAEPAMGQDPATELGPLARNKALVEDSANTRDAITKLLETVKVPATPTQ